MTVISTEGSFKYDIPQQKIDLCTKLLSAVKSEILNISAFHSKRVRRQFQIKVLGNSIFALSVLKINKGFY